ncbi:MAG: hypothetical protein HYX86_01095 [Chloroflexi bacterium]|nr:hypothetical protein [Chloroflexota bacterium]
MASPVHQDLPMKTISRLQWTNLVIGFTIPFGLLTVGYFLLNLIVFQGRILVERSILLPVFVGNIILSSILGWWIYKNRWHAILRYGDAAFELTRGKNKFSGEWRDFRNVSLFHAGMGKFTVRLYRDGTEFVEVPASDLKMDPSAFRFEAMRLIQGSKA